MDEETRTHLQERRESLLTALATCTFSEAELLGMFEELAELSAALGPDMEDTHNG